MLTLHVPLTPENHHLVDAAFLAKTKPGAVLINCGRGGLVDLDAAHDALQSGQLCGVGLDVFEPEPPRTTRSSTTRTSRSPRTSWD